MNFPPRAPSSLSTATSTSSTSSTRSKVSLTSLRVTNLYKATMNRFLTRKKTEAALEGAEAPPPSTKKSKKGKKNKEEPKPELDLSQALPSSDNFRTSLLMPNLSARFSMLREQDDPESKLGKASDDSVLHPKRQSRLTDFGFNPAGLTDIAEVSSINSSIRPPFLSERSGSIDGGYATDDGDSIHSGSVMSRSRPGEGNVLFGGRQKVYLGNRALYDDDVGMSAYQRIRAEERRKKMEEDTAAGRYDGHEEEEPESPARELKHSSSFSGSLRRRETASSTTSGVGARASTAATSIASQGANSIPPPSASSTAGHVLERTGTKGRRLYEQGLDRNIQEGNTAINRLNSLQKQRTAIGGRATPPLTQTRSATNLSDRYNRTGQYRAASPPPSAPLANMSNFMATKEVDSQQSSPALGTSSPTSPFPPISPLDENNPLNSHIQPGDRGKATAMGAFNKPASQFDENQYLQRQKQMMQGRDTPPLNKPSRSPSRAVQEKLDKFEMKRRESDAKFKQPPPSKTVSDARKRLDALRSEIAADLDDLRPSSDSEDEPERKAEERPARPRTRTNSSTTAPPVPKIPASPPKPIALPKPVSPPTQPLPPKPVSPPSDAPTANPVSPAPETPVPAPLSPREGAGAKPAPAEKSEKPSAFSVFQRAKQQMQASGAVDSPQDSPEKEQGTFFASPGSSDDEDDAPVPEPLRSPVSRRGPSPASKQQSPVVTRSNPISVGSSPALRSPPPVHEHPALRSQGPISPVSRASESMLQALNSPNESERKSSVSTLVKSDATDLDSPTLGPDNGGLNGMIRQHLRNQSQQSGVSSVYDNEREDFDEDQSHNHTSQPSAMSMVSETPAHSSYSHSNPWDLEDLDGGYYGEADSLSSVSPVDTSRSKAQPFPRPSTNMEAFRSEPARSQQQEREEVIHWEQEMKSKHTRNLSQSTLAEREAFQKDLEERQKAIQEALKNKVDTESRSSSPTPGMGGAFKAFGMLRAKSSKDTLASRPGGNSKAMNMLGVSGNSSNVSLARGSEEQLRRPKEKITKIPVTTEEADYRRDFEDRLTRGASGDAQATKSRSPSAQGTGRSRSNSNVSGVSARSRSRNGPRESEEQMPPPLPSQIPRSGLPTPESPIVEPPPNPPAPRMRSGSRPGYFDAKSLHPIQTGLPLPLTLTTLLRQSHLRLKLVAPEACLRNAKSQSPSRLSPSLCSSLRLQWLTLSSFLRAHRSRTAWMKSPHPFRRSTRCVAVLASAVLIPMDPAQRTQTAGPALMTAIIKRADRDYGRAVTLHCTGLQTRRMKIRQR
ncbi:hypothetical protein MPH_02121 [Macrophomina phaseolina MS6]|uniref:Uncharacterized protein n=1 Tax=Macrophomina phaseolina (strain MS6) TaxID=1126212 RepID=K2SDX5_MACPH|nr:hypothetical protein MPH_02121 [Macrophomina phaseolina MS6]